MVSFIYTSTLFFFVVLYNKTKSKWVLDVANLFYLLRVGFARFGLLGDRSFRSAFLSSCLIFVLLDLLQVYMLWLLCLRAICLAMQHLEHCLTIILPWYCMNSISNLNSNNWFCIYFSYSFSLLFLCYKHSLIVTCVPKYLILSFLFSECCWRSSWIGGWNACWDISFHYQK